MVSIQEKINDKQFNALKLYNRGYTRRQAAEALGISENTYAWYLKRVRAIFKISSRKEMLELEEELMKFG